MTVAAQSWRPRRPPTTCDADRAWALIEEMRPLVEAHITPERVLRYARAIATTSAPSTVANMTRAPVLHALLAEDAAFDLPLRLDDDFERTGTTVLMSGNGERKPLWFLAHLDTISYLVQPRRNGLYPLVPFCYHLIASGSRPAQALRYDLAAGALVVCAEGELISIDGTPYFRPAPSANVELRPGDRIVPIAEFRLSEDGGISAHLDNAGGVAALAVAAPVLARLGVNAMFAFPDEEEGPHGSGNQMIGRGSARFVARREPPDLAVVVDMQQAAVEDDGTAVAGRLGAGALLAEFSSLARGAVTPPPLYALAREIIDRLRASGVAVQESPNAYSSRSDDISVMLRTSAILLLGFPGYDRHFDYGFPRAHLSDLTNLSKSLVYMAALAAVIGDRSDHGISIDV